MQKAIYEPKGKAKEYGNLACNLYRGCGHECTYCYAPSVLRMDRQEFYNNPQPRKGIIEALKRDAKRIGDKYKKDLSEHSFRSQYSESPAISFTEKEPEHPEVFLCFTTDPYQPINAEHQLTRQAIEILHANEIAVNILTKGKITDFDLLAKRPDLSKVGITLSSTHHATSREWERAAEQPNIRMQNIQTAHDLGIPTWISLEPVIRPSSTLDVIRWAHSITDVFKIGKWNYDARANNINWHRFVTEAIALCEKLGCNYYIKEDLRKYIKE